jgi:hypothetical protein
MDRAACVAAQVASAVNRVTGCRQNAGVRASARAIRVLFVDSPLAPGHGRDGIPQDADEEVRERGSRLMDRRIQQVDMEQVQNSTIMKSVEFKAGVEDVRGGMPARFDEFALDHLWAYERGRLFAHLAPRSMPIKVGGKLNPKALALFRLAGQRGLIP